VHGGRFLPGPGMPESLRALQDWVTHQQSFWPEPGAVCHRRS
jgi:hypothetical protein